MTNNKIKQNTEGGLWLTAMERIVLDDHAYESFAEPGDQLLFTAKEISNGIGINQFQGRLFDALRKQKDALSQLNEVKE